MTCCSHSWMFTDHSKVCRDCGLERLVLRMDRYWKHSAPLNRGYDRSGRFKVKLDKLFGLHTGPPFADPIWEQLQAVRHKLSSPSDVRRTLRSIRLKNKHYDSLRMFCDTFTKFKVVVPNPVQLKERLLRRFREIHTAWSARIPHKPFFSYDFLLRYLLVEANSSLLAYCKPATSRRRQQKYLEKLRIIQARIVDASGCRGHAVHRSRNESIYSANLRGPQTSGEDQAESAEEEHRAPSGDPEADLEPSRPNNSEVSKDGSGTSGRAFSALRKAYLTFHHDR